MSLKNSRQMYSIINDLLKRLNLVRDPEKALSIISHTAYKYIGFRKNNPSKITIFLLNVDSNKLQLILQ